MPWRLIHNILFLLMLALVSSCHSASIYNVENVPYRAKETLTTEKAGRVIRLAARKRGWITKQIQPGLIEAIITVDSRVALVEIKYDKSKFSIFYKSSQNLNLHGDEINKHYNVWIKQLENEIWLLSSDM